MIISWLCVSCIIKQNSIQQQTVSERSVTVGYLGHCHSLRSTHVISLWKLPSLHTGDISGKWAQLQKADFYLNTAAHPPLCPSWSFLSIREPFGRGDLNRHLNPAQHHSGLAPGSQTSHLMVTVAAIFTPVRSGLSWESSLACSVISHWVWYHCGSLRPFSVFRSAGSVSCAGPVM